MKKIFTLLFSTFMIGSVFAQAAVVSPRPVFNHAITFDGKFYHYDESYSFSRYERNLKIRNIDEDYNKALKNIVTMRFLSAAQKIKLIRTIELKRAEQIAAVNARFNDRRNKYNDHYYDRDFNWRR
jgi:hypothetical protein